MGTFKIMYIYTLLIKSYNYERFNLATYCYFILIIGWLLDKIYFKFGDFMYILLVIAVILIIFKLVTGRRL